MKILHTESSYGWGGQEIRILNESNGMIARGHQVTVACPISSNIFKAAQKKGISATSIEIGKKNISAVIRMRSLIQAIKPDVINCHSSTDSWLVVAACFFLTQRPRIVRTRHVSSPIPKNLLSKWVYKHGFDAIVTTGNKIKQQIIDETGAVKEKIISIPTGIDPKIFHPATRSNKARLGLNEKKNYIGIVATLRSWKGHLHLLEAFSNIRARAPNWELVIVGDGPYRSSIEKSINDFSINDSVTLAGHQENPEEWLRAIDIFCLPSYANEGVPQAVLQAMLSALPIVTTDAGAILEAIRNEFSGLVVEKKSPTSIQNALEKLINNPDLRRSLGNAAQRYALDHFSFGKMIEEMELVFQNKIITHK